MDIRDLRYVIALNDCGTLTKAAERLHVSRQAVAKTVRNVEAEAGARLFDKAQTDRQRVLFGKRRVCKLFFLFGGFFVSGQNFLFRCHCASLPT